MLEKYLEKIYIFKGKKDYLNYTSTRNGEYLILKHLRNMKV